MDFFQAAMLALIQGLTEFLPISSSAHLILPSQLLGWPDQGLAFDVGVHVGTLAAVVFYFRRDLTALIGAWLASLAGRRSTEAALAWYLALATVPAVLAGFFLNDLIEHYARSILVIAGTTLIFGVLLWYADSRRTESRRLDTLGLRDAVTIGLAQALALIPGTSRSGITITAGLMLGLERQAAARFSFLLSIPIILGAGLFKGMDLYKAGSVESWELVGFGALLAAVSAWVCITLFLSWLNRIGMLPFVIYRLALGVALLGVYFAG
ncbi:undecaprenyl-diphosphatase 1 [Marinobacterium nitratireducens]|uniref:Undecaprenyl-diphosphatase n=1 Tax=Marinobacterium nitratireducens TaxID=518897 RepID=A0A917ZFH4_9GAMM|nr:undecaprenyl-diphosphate phosphatase [Marinobacterium nitratireducens]GGO82161.1 undecaprenyl-diphosphatase 1 [Marinobacterium nitratireducens]